MAYNIVFLPKAIEDIDHSVEWYKSINLELAKQFLAEIDATLNLIKTNPLLFPCIIDNYRVVNTSKFPFKIVYRINKKNIITIVVFHHKRNQKKLTSRIK